MRTASRLCCGARCTGHWTLTGPGLPPLVRLCRASGATTGASAGLNARSGSATNEKAVATVQAISAGGGRSTGTGRRSCGGFE